MWLVIRAPFYFLLVILFSSSCKKSKVELQADCGCDGSAYLTIENVQARHAGNGFFVINKTDTNGKLTYGSACDSDSTWEVSTDEKIWNYTISGDLKKRCPSANQEYELTAPGGLLQITSIKKITEI
jgi:hypothetical protein